MADEKQMNQDPAIPPEAEVKAERAARDLRTAAQGLWDDAVDRARSFQDDSKQYVRENPTKAVITALGVGFVLGLTFRRLG
jgi:ElaB/YqjD/DUF883 family membrane-anchored ribosome-binding protein